MPKGRPPVFKTPKEMLDKWNNYVEECKEQEEPITRLGFAVSVGFHRGLYFEYKNKDDFSDVLAYIDCYSENNLTNRALKGEYNSNIAKLVLSAKHSVHEKTQQEQTGNITLNIGNEDKDL